MGEQRIEHALRDRHVIGRGHEDEPLVDYAVLAATFLALTGSAIALAARRGAIPPRTSGSDLVLLGLATTRLSRLLTREKVARPLRAPFTDVEPTAAPGETRERPRGEGPVRAIGELLTCPRCAAVWAGAALTIGHLLAPGPTRVACTILASSLISDVANLAIAHSQR